MRDRTDVRAEARVFEMHERACKTNGPAAVWLAAVLCVELFPPDEDFSRAIAPDDRSGIG